MRRWALVVGCVGASLVSTSTAWADDDDPPPLPPPAAAPAPPPSGDAPISTTPGGDPASIDSVYLRSGGLFRGRVSEIVPGDHVTITTASGESKRIAWSDIDRVIVASTPVPTVAGPAGRIPAGTGPLPAPMVGPRARVHLTTGRNLMLYRKPAGTGGWVQACSQPCDLELPVGDTYRVIGNGNLQSKEFHLDAPPNGAVEITVDPPSGAGMVLGGVLAGTGATAAYVGLLMTLAGAAEGGSRRCSSGSYSCLQSKNDADEVRNAGLITMGVGAAMTAVGIFVFLSSAKTDIDQKAAGRSEGKAARPLDAFLRQPGWDGSRSSASSSERATPAPAAAFPVVFAGSF